LIDVWLISPDQGIASLSPIYWLQSIDKLMKKRPSFSLVAVGCALFAGSLFGTEHALAQGPGPLTFSQLQLAANGHVITLQAPGTLPGDATFSFPDLTGITTPDFIVSNSAAGQTIAGGLTMTGAVNINNSGSGATTIGNTSAGTISLVTGGNITANMPTATTSNFLITGGKHAIIAGDGISLSSDGSNYGIEVVQNGGTPYIDFSSDNTQDYTARIIAGGNDLTNIISNVNGSKYIVNDGTNAFLTVTKNGSIGDVVVTGSLSSSQILGAAVTPASGGIYNDNVVIAWGDVAAAGVVNDQFGNSAVVHTPGTGVYTITLPNAPTAASTVVTLQSLGLTTVTRAGSVLTVTTYDITGTPTDLDFYFQVVGRP